jgi:hypothetical protein
VCGRAIRLTKRSSPTPTHRACRRRKAAPALAAPTSTRLREHLAAAAAADPAVEVLVVEACRIADRLDEIDRIVTGKAEWIQLMHFRLGNGEEQKVYVSLDSVLSEARQQVTALKGVLAQLGVGKAVLAPADDPGKAGDPVDEIAARRAARGGATSRLGQAGRSPG